jgi:hypothetical protein
MINSNSIKQRKKKKSPKNLGKLLDKRMIVDTTMPFDEIVEKVIDRSENEIWSFVIVKSQEQKDRFEARFNELPKKQQKLINVLLTI